MQSMLDSMQCASVGRCGIRLGALLALCTLLPGVCGGGTPRALSGHRSASDGVTPSPFFVMPAVSWWWPPAGLHHRGKPGARVPRTAARGNDGVPLRRARLALRQEAGADGAQSRQEPGAPAAGVAHTAGAAAESAAESHMGRKTIGIDHGRKRTGVCVSVGYAPRPLPLICHDDNCTHVALQVAQIARNEGAEQIVVGFPFNSTGGEGEQAVYTRQFVSALQEACTTCAIYLWDERFSTSVAREKLQQAGYNRMDMKGLVDTVASIGILSDFFDKNGLGAEQVQEKSSTGTEGYGIGEVPLVPVLSYKERLKQMQAAATADAAAGGGKRRKKRK